MRLRLEAPGSVLVTGAGSGIGRAVALEFAGRSTTVVVTDVDEVTAKETASLVAERGGTAVVRALDVTSPDAWVEVVGDVGVPDVLVNNAGKVYGGTFLDHSAADWSDQLGVNLLGVVHGCRVVGQAMVSRGEGGQIVNIASAASYTPVPGMSAYCVSKAGVKMLSECLRTELGPHGIGVTAICPGFIDTNIGEHGTLVGVPADVVDRGKDLLARVRAVGERLPIDIASPRQVARAVRAAVVLDPSLVPVRPEAWYGYVLSRVSPGLVRQTTAPFRRLAGVGR